MNREIIVICGPTAVGKTEYAIEVALAFNGEIVSCDSMQLYKYIFCGKISTAGKRGYTGYFSTGQGACNRRRNGTLSERASLRYGFQYASR